MGDKTILISQPFALRQQKGAPVYTKIKTEILPHKKEFIEKYEVFEKMGYKLADRKKRIRRDFPLDLNKLERIIITPNGKGYLSTYFLDFMKEFNVPIYFVNGRGMVDSCFMPIYHKKPSLIVKQCEARITGKDVQIAKYIITLKLESQGMERFIPKLMEAKDLKEIMYVEARGSKFYFDQWNLPCKFNWTGRHGRTQNVNAVDPVNAVLNLGYGILAQGVSEILLERGFELSIGFLHYSEQNYWNQLTFDLLEPQRILIDEAVKNIIENSIFDPEDFTFTKNRSHLVLKDKPFEKVLDRFLQALDKLENKSLPMIRKIEKMLSGSHIDDS